MRTLLLAVSCSAALSFAAEPELDDATLKARSHAFLDANDRADVKTVTADLAPNFVQAVLARTYAAPFYLKSLSARAERNEKPRTRTYLDERTFVGPTSATWFAHDVQHYPADGDYPGGDRDGWTTLVWVKDGASWKVTLWEFMLAGDSAERESWNDTLRISNQFSRKPNAFLVEMAKGRKPGSALDVAMGEGRNGVYLATQGWKVTGVDIADQGLALAQKRAADARVKIETVVADMSTFDFGKNKYDLVTFIYCGTDHAVLEKVKTSLKKGGLVVIEFFAKDNTAGTGISGFAPGELAALFKDGFAIVKDDVIEDVADWGLARGKLVRFAAQKK